MSDAWWPERPEGAAYLILHDENGNTTREAIGVTDTRERIHELVDWAYDKKKVYIDGVEHSILISIGSTPWRMRLSGQISASREVLHATLERPVKWGMTVDEVVDCIRNGKQVQCKTTEETFRPTALSFSRDGWRSGGVDIAYLRKVD